MIEIEVTSVSTSKKGTMWLQVKVTDMDHMEPPTVGTIYEINAIGKVQKAMKEKDEKDTE